MRTNPSGISRQTYWTLRCDCGSLTEVAASNLDRTNSCGCLLAEARATGLSGTHRMSGTPVYLRWTSIKKCRPPEWETFERFYADVGDPPFEGAMLAAPDPTKPTGPTNFMWVSREDRVKRGITRGKTYLTLNGVTKHAAAWARDLGITREAIRQRLAKGWPIEKVLGPITINYPGRNTKCFLTIEGETKSLREWEKILGISYAALYQRWKWQRLRELEEKKRESDNAKSKSEPVK